MADILVQYKTKKFGIKKYRLWNTVVDQWVSKPMHRDQMIGFLENYQYAKHSKKEAIERVDRIGYSKDHLAWLNEYFDTKVDELSRRAACNRKEKQ